MAVINFANREISCKIVYFGPSGAGCNSNVRTLHAHIEQETGRLHRFAPKDSVEATWYFEYTKPGGRLNGFRMRFRVYSLPGGIVDERHRTEVLREADGIVFVADARSPGLAGNEAALLDLEEALAEQKIELAGLPVVLQVNHTDAEDSVEQSTVVRPLNAYGFPVRRAAAKQKIGVLETFDAILEATRTGVLDSFAGTTRSMVLRAHHAAGEQEDEVVRAHLQAIHGLPGTPVAPQRTDWFEPEDEIEIAFQPRDYAGSHPVRILDATIDEGQVVIDVELERMGGGSPRGLRIRLANRPTDQPIAPTRPSSPVAVASSPILGVTDHLPDKIDLGGMPLVPDDLPGVWYGIAGVAGGIVAGLLIGFLLFH